MRQTLYALIIAASATSITACAFDGLDGQDRGTAQDEDAPAAPALDAVQPPEHLDDALAREIAKIKLGPADAASISPSVAACGKTGPNLGNEHVNDASSPGAAQQRSGSSTSCVARGALQPTDDAVYFCFTGASDGTWTYLQNLRTGVRGWTRDDLLKPPAGTTAGGSSVFCGF
jgi:predicted small lipoprotein YifL